MRRINHCDLHRIYTGGCQDCLARNRAYMKDYRERAKSGLICRNNGNRSDANWRRMTEIGLRYEAEAGRR